MSVKDHELRSNPEQDKTYISRGKNLWVVNEIDQCKIIGNSAHFEISTIGFVQINKSKSAEFRVIIITME